jgi:tRNA threonylcarbamoyladenosine biosynthesis protein TsaE
MSAALEWRGLDEAGLVALAERMALPLRAGGVIHLSGELGAGKTTFCRALIRALGVGERVKSPTYSLIESYRVGSLHVHHLDLYRIAHADELEWLGLPDLLEGETLLLVEWPERGASALPPADLEIRLSHAGESRDVCLGAVSSRGQDVLDACRSILPGRGDT